MPDYIPQISLDQQNLELKIVEVKRLIDRIEQDLGIFAWEPSEEMPKADISLPKPLDRTFPASVSKIPLFSPMQTLKNTNDRSPLTQATQQSQKQEQIKREVESVSVRQAQMRPVEMTQPALKETTQTQKDTVENTISVVPSNEKDYSAVKEKLKQLEEMKATVESLRQNIEGMKSQQAQPNQQQTQPQRQQQYIVKQQPQVTQAEIENLNALIRKLNDLVNSNFMVANELKEILNETRNANKSSRISELMKRLAEASTNG